MPEGYPGNLPGIGNEGPQYANWTFEDEIKLSEEQVQVKKQGELSESEKRIKKLEDDLQTLELNPKSNDSSLEEYRRAEIEKELASLRGLQEAAKRNGQAAIVLRDKPGQIAERQEPDKTLAQQDNGERRIVPYVEEDKTIALRDNRGTIVPHKEEDKTIALRDKSGPIVPYQEQDKRIVPLPEQREKIRIIDVSEVVKAMAWRQAENRLNEIVYMQGWKDRREGWLRGMFKSQIAKMGERGYLSKFYNEALAEITNNQDLMRDIQARLAGQSAGESNRGSADKREQWLIFDEVIKAAEENVLEAGERGQDVVVAGNIFADLFNRHIRGEFADRAAFEQAAREAIERAVNLGVIRREQFTSHEAVDRGEMTEEQFRAHQSEAEGLMYASNLWEVAEGQRQRIENNFGERGEWEKLTPEQRKSLESAISGIGNLDIQLGNKIRDVLDQRPERPDRRRGYLRWFDRFANSVRTRPILGAITNPAVIGFLSSSLARGAVRNTVLVGATAAGIGTAAGFGLPVLVGAGLAGVYGYINRHRNLAYDRGLEQRREALGLQGEGQRAQRLRDFGFSEISQDARTLLDAINTGNANALNEAAALLQVERSMMHADRPVDLITVDAEEGRELGTNLLSKTELRIALKNHAGEINEDAVNARVAEIRAAIAEQDQKFEKYRGRESWKAAGFAAGTGAVAGVVASEIGHWVHENLGRHVTEKVSLLEYAAGQRPQIAHYEYNGQNILPGHTVNQLLTTNNGQPVSINWRLNNEGHWQLDPNALPPGFTYDPTKHVIIQHIPGVPGGAINGQNWGGLREHLESKYSDLFDRSHVHWRGFGYNQTPPQGDSYHPELGYFPHSEGTELNMSYHSGENGSVVIDVSSMLGKTAFGGGHEVHITSEMLDKLAVTIGPRERALSHDVLISHFNNGKLEIPKELADQIFAISHGHIHLKPGFQITANDVLGEIHGGKGGSTNLYSLAADYRPGAAPHLHDQVVEGPGGGAVPPPIKPIPPQDIPYGVPGDPKFIPEQKIDPPIVIPYDPRRPIGNPKRPDKGKTENDKPNPPDKIKSKEKEPPKSRLAAFMDHLRHRDQKKPESAPAIRKPAEDNRLREIVLVTVNDRRINLAEKNNPEAAAAILNLREGYTQSELDHAYRQAQRVLMEDTIIIRRGIEMSRILQDNYDALSAKAKKESIISPSASAPAASQDKIKTDLSSKEPEKQSNSDEQKEKPQATTATSKQEPTTPKPERKTGRENMKMLIEEDKWRLDSLDEQKLSTLGASIIKIRTGHHEHRIKLHNFIVNVVDNKHYGLKDQGIDLGKITFINGLDRQNINVSDLSEAEFDEYLFELATVFNQKLADRKKENIRSGMFENSSNTQNRVKV